MTVDFDQLNLSISKGLCPNLFWISERMCSVSNNQFYKLLNDYLTFNVKL